ncbi:MAG: NAD(+) diphosphatase [Ktedonobacteraceae bacterium]
MFPTFIRAYPPSQPALDRTYWLPFIKDEVLVERHGKEIALIQADRQEMQAQLLPQEVLYIGVFDGVPCMACEVGPEFAVPAELHAISLRELFSKLDDDAYGVVGYALQLLYWRRTSHYCPVCGHIPQDEVGTWGRRCPNCGHIAYPHVTPAILALVHDGERMLLTHKPGWGKRYSCIAGFTEPGESLEECVQREVYEEVGLEVTDVQYVGSQPWPFPHQLMVGYTARYVGGTLRLEEQELDDALWFSIDALPEMPPPLSLAYHIIKGWIETTRQRQQDTGSNT